VVYDPAKDEMFTAEKGSGAWMNNRRLRVSARRDMSEMLFGTGIPFMGSRELPRTLRDLAHLMPRCAGVRRNGAAALDLAWVAAGRFDGFWERRLNLWDIAAGCLLVREAGGILRDTDDDARDPLATCSVMAANAEVAEPLLALLRAA
jgi:myo-inositol-1(or 4)-monophosphatase